MHHMYIVQRLLISEEGSFNILLCTSPGLSSTGCWTESASSWQSVWCSPPGSCSYCHMASHTLLLWNITSKMIIQVISGRITWHDSWPSFLCCRTPRSRWRSPPPWARCCCSSSSGRSSPCRLCCSFHSFHWRGSLTRKPGIRELNSHETSSCHKVL